MYAYIVIIVFISMCHMSLVYGMESQTAQPDIETIKNTTKTGLLKYVQQQKDKNVSVADIVKQLEGFQIGYKTKNDTAKYQAVTEVINELTQPAAQSVQPAMPNVQRRSTTIVPKLTDFSGRKEYEKKRLMQYVQSKKRQNVPDAKIVQLLSKIKENRPADSPEYAATAEVIEQLTQSIKPSTAQVQPKQPVTEAIKQPIAATPQRSTTIAAVSQSQQSIPQSQQQPAIPLQIAPPPVLQADEIGILAMGDNPTQEIIIFSKDEIAQSEYLQNMIKDLKQLGAFDRNRVELHHISLDRLKKLKKFQNVLLMPYDQNIQMGAWQSEAAKEAGNFLEYEKKVVNLLSTYGIQDIIDFVHLLTDLQFLLFDKNKVEALYYLFPKILLEKLENTRSLNDVKIILSSNLPFYFMQEINNLLLKSYKITDILIYLSKKAKPHVWKKDTLFKLKYVLNDYVVALGLHQSSWFDYVKKMIYRSNNQNGPYISIYNIKTQTETTIPFVANGITRPSSQTIMTISPDGTRIACFLDSHLNYSFDTLFIFDTSTKQYTQYEGHKGSVIETHFSKTNNSIVYIKTRDWDASYTIWHYTYYKYILNPGNILQKENISEIDYNNNIAMGALLPNISGRVHKALWEGGYRGIDSESIFYSSKSYQLFFEKIVEEKPQTIIILTLLQQPQLSSDTEGALYLLALDIANYDFNKVNPMFTFEKVPLTTTHVVDKKEELAKKAAATKWWYRYVK